MHRINASRLSSRLPVALHLFAALVTVALMTTSTLLAQEPQFSAQQLEFFEQKIRPVLAEQCYSCHSGTAVKLQAALRVDSRQSLLAGGDSGPAISIEEPEHSLLLESVRYEGYEMPPSGKLPDDVIADFEAWVNDGAPWPNEEVAEGQAAEQFDLQKRKSEHWVWQPIDNPSVPSVKAADWPRDDIDRFILAAMEQAEAAPAGDIDEASLLRRLYFDIVGLPPQPQDVLDYLQDTSPDKLPRLVDKLLASPHFGERWGRHWLDLVRYAESRGHEFDNDSRNAYQYRDYVIRALNADVPYDQFVREHIAGDLLENPRLYPETGGNESILGTGFWFLGEWVHSPVDIRKDESDRFDNMIDVMSKTFLGVTVSCARCHDHKFDAISTEDYYALCGFLQSSDYRQVRFESMEKNRLIAQRLAESDASFQEQISSLLKKGSHEETSTATTATLPDSIAEKTVFDYRHPAAPALRQNGFLFSQRSAGQLVLSAYSADAITVGETGLSVQACDATTSDAFWNDLETIDESGMNRRGKLREIPRAGRTLRTETFLLKSGQVDCLVSGNGHIVACVDSHRLIAGPLHGETVVGVKPGKPWMRLNLSRYVGHRIHLEFTPAENASLSVQYIVQGASSEEKNRIASIFQAQEKQSKQAATNLASQINADAATALRVDELVKQWQAKRKQLQEKILKRSQLAMAMMDGTGEDDNLLIRGSSSNPGPVVPRRFLTAVDGPRPETYHGSGRLELADQINAPANPLTSRVIANRIWHHLLGRGIVPTTDDFGVLGQRPSHPELLDHLAVRFRQKGQSIKAMIKIIVLSRTYQMSGERSPELAEQDPNNLLFHYRPPKRLQGEAIRDSLLEISGTLDRDLFGEPVPVHLTDFMSGRGRPGKQGPLDGGHRRSIYTAVRRNFLPPFMLAFDTPVPFSSMGRRTVSNVPAQALIMLNHPLVRELSGKWAQRSDQASRELPKGLTNDPAACEPSETDRRIRWMYLSAYARLPQRSELEAVRQFVHSRNEDPWQQLAHALVNAKEFIYVR